MKDFIIPHPHSSVSGSNININNKKILVTGAGGMLASSLKIIVHKLNLNHNWIFLTKQQLDITNYKAVQESVIQLKPDWIVNTAAYTKVDGAESDFADADAVNHCAVAHIADLCAIRNIKLLHISTDYVFSGNLPAGKLMWSETDTPEPVNNYGITKLAGEQSVIESDIHYIIARTSWLFAEQGNNFVTKMYRRFHKGGAISVVNDQTGKPTYSNDLAYMLILLLQNDYQGIIHICNQGVTTWYQLALTLKGYLQSDMEINPCLSSEYPVLATRPLNSALDCTLLGNILKPTETEMRNWQAALAEVAGKLIKQDC